MSKINEVKLISQQVSKGSQDVNYEEIFNIGDNALKINIKSDSYDFQCHAKVSWLNRKEHKWEVLHNIHHGRMKTQTSLCYHPEAQDMEGNKQYFISEFWQDREELVKIAKQLI